MASSPAVTVAVLLGARADALGLPAEMLAGAAGLTRPITSPHIQKTGLALARAVPCLLATGAVRPPAEVAQVCDQEGVALLLTSGTTGGTIARLTTLLEDSLAERQVVHAVLMDLLGLGVLITGESGIGKSECALDLIMRGHRLVADDTVEVRRRAEMLRSRGHHAARTLARRLDAKLRRADDAVAPPGVPADEDGTEAD